MRGSQLIARHLDKNFRCCLNRIGAILGPLFERVCKSLRDTKPAKLALNSFSYFCRMGEQILRPEGIESGGWRIGIVMRGNFYAKTPRTGPKRNAADASIFVLAIFGASDFADELLGQGLRLATVLGLISAGGARLQVKR